jgi:hypothetical protein
MRATELLIAVACALLTACPRGDQIRITGAGTDEPGAFCSDFRLNEAQARAFFAKAKPITAEQMNREFTWLPCYVEGTIARGGGNPVKFRIRAIGIGEIFLGGEKREWLGCKDCDRLFPPK